MKNYNKYDKLELNWLDSTSTQGWKEPKDFKEPCLKCKSIGYFIEKTKIGITICQSTSSDEEADYITIPLVAIKKITKIS